MDLHYCPNTAVQHKFKLTLQGDECAGFQEELPVLEYVLHCWKRPSLDCLSSKHMVKQLANLLAAWKAEL